MGRLYLKRFDPDESAGAATCITSAQGTRPMPTILGVDLDQIAGKTYDFAFMGTFERRLDAIVRRDDMHVAGMSFDLHARYWKLIYVPVKISVRL